MLVFVPLAVLAVASQTAVAVTIQAIQAAAANTTLAAGWHPRRAGDAAVPPWRPTPLPSLAMYPGALVQDQATLRAQGLISNILWIVAIVAVVLFALLLCRNQGDIKETVQDIVDDPRQALHEAVGEGKDIYRDAQRDQRFRNLPCC